MIVQGTEKDMGQYIFEPFKVETVENLHSLRLAETSRDQRAG